MAKEFVWHLKNPTERANATKHNIKHKKAE